LPVETSFDDGQLDAISVNPLKKVCGKLPSEKRDVTLRWLMYESLINGCQGNVVAA